MVIALSNIAPIFRTVLDGNTTESPTDNDWSNTLAMFRTLPSIMNSVIQFQKVVGHPGPNPCDTCLHPTYCILTVIWVKGSIELCVISIKVDINIVLMSN